MVLRTLTIFLLLFAVKNVLPRNNDTDDFSVVSTSQKPSPSEFENNTNERFSKIELQFEMRDVLSALKESITHLQKAKQEIIEEVEGTLQNKFKIYDAELRDHLSKTEETVKDHLTVTKNELVDQMIALKESTKLSISEVRSTIETHFKDMEAKKCSEFNKIQNQLTTIEGTEQTIKKQLAETKDEMVNQMNMLKKSTNLVLSESEKCTARIQSNALFGKFDEIKNQSTKTQEEILTKVEKYDNVSRDCREVQKRGYNTSGIYRIQPTFSLQSFLVWCDMSTRGGGWTYVINRFDGSQDFYRNWTDYKQGFGNISGEHWLGLEHLYELTNSKSSDLLFELVDWNSKMVYAFYNSFKVGSEFENYRINSLRTYSGDAGDSFRRHFNAQFSTRDKDHSDGCPSSFEGSWWYTNCYQVHLTGKYVHDPVPGTYYKSAIKWNEFHGYNYGLKEVRMMIRPHNN